MPESKTISLLIPPEPSSNSQNLHAQIQQIVSQKGHFRHVTEQSLRAEIHGKEPHNDALPADTLSQDQNEADEDGTPQKRQERLWKRRDEMLERLSYAQNEILCALDFVSLLISKQSVPAQSSMSPALKEAVPIGTLASHVLQHKAPATAMQKQLNLASQGWRSDSFRSAAEKLSGASARLQADAEKESKYWAQVADLTARGWPISRLPRDTKAIGVHFGFPEAAPQFRDRGFALLRQSEDGTVDLDGQRKRRRLGIYVTQDDKRTGSFHFRAVENGHHTDLNQKITEARNSLFEEELFYEIGREARLIANQGVITRGQVVEVAIGRHSRISLIYGEEEHEHGALLGKDNEIAEFVGISLRLLLTAAHEQNLARRSQRPPVMTLKPRSTPPYALIRPVLTHLRHRAQLSAFLSSCDALVRVFTVAGLSMTVETKDSSAEVFKSLKVDSSSTILSDLMLPAKTAVELSLPTSRRLQIGLATLLGPPLFGSRFEASEIRFGFCTMAASHHETLDSVLSFIRHVLSLDLVAHVEALAEKVSNESQNADVSKSKEWKVSGPHSGELALHESGGAIKKIQLSVQAQSCNIRLISQLKTSTSKSMMWSWAQQGSSKADEQGIAEDSERKFNDVVIEMVAPNDG